MKLAWTVIKDEDTGKLVFYNRLSGTTHEERPRGVKVSIFFNKQRILTCFDSYLLPMRRNGKNTKQTQQVSIEKENNIYIQENVDVILDPTITAAKIGQWEEVAPEEDFYAQHQIDPRILEVPKEEAVDEDERVLEEKLELLDEMDEDQMNDLLNLEKQEYGKSLLKSKTDKLKKLIDSNFEAVAKPTFQKVKIEAFSC